MGNPLLWHIIRRDNAFLQIRRDNALLQELRELPAPKA